MASTAIVHDLRRYRGNMLRLPPTQELAHMEQGHDKNGLFEKPEDESYDRGTGDSSTGQVTAMGVLPSCIDEDRPSCQARPMNSGSLTTASLESVSEHTNRKLP